MAKLPNFRTIEEEADFWETHSLTDYLDELEDVDFTVDLATDSFIAIPADSEIIGKIHEIAQNRGISTQALLIQHVESLLA